MTGLTTALAIDPGGPGHDPLPGRDIGGVTIVRLIAAGGMGRVYEGRQEKPGRTVAVKVMRPGLTSATLLRRFEYEAEVLGRLQHPGIAHIYAVGVHEVDHAPVPYFVMEYIPDAKPLTTYAHQLALPTRQRLELFRSVCEAVAHGHQKGVIHRDLKPSNIVVDRFGQTKVIDFGIARATGSDIAITTVQTDVGQLLGTLQYMSPEQFDADPGEIDVRSDVYSLGVVLYELLTGTPPYDVRRKPVFDAMRIVKEEEPTPISRLDTTLRRDVAIIAGTCLRKDKADRYSSAAELAGDVARYLAGEPIVAAQPSLWSAVSRAARRHKAAVAAVAGVAISLVAAVVGITVFALRADHARMTAERARRTSEAATRDAEDQRAAADRQRLAAIQSQAAEAKQRRIAEAESLRAKQRLYVSTIQRLAAACDRPHRRVTAGLFQDAETCYRDAYGVDAPLPAEFSCLRPLLDESLVVFAGHTDSITAAALGGPDGTRLATASIDGTARLWDTVTGACVSVFRPPADHVVALAYSPDGTRIATASPDGTTHVWDVASGESRATLTGHTGRITRIAYSPDGTRLATGSQDGTARLWDAADDTLVAVLAGHESGITSLAFSADGAILATASIDATARIWNGVNGEPRATLTGHTAPVFFVASSQDGARIATAANDRTVRLWDASTGSVVAEHDMETRFGQLTHCVAMNAAGTRFAAAFATNSVRLWDATGDGEGMVLEGHDDRVTCAVFSPEGSRLATGSSDGTVRLWDTVTGNAIAVLRGHEGEVRHVLFSADGKRLVTTSRDGTARLWHADPTDSLAVFDSQVRFVSAVAFSADGDRFATSVPGVAAEICDTATCRPIGRVPQNSLVDSISFSPDGSRLLTTGWFSPGGSRGPCLWDAVTGAAVAKLEGHEHFIMGVAWSRDGNRLATASRDRTARSWNAVTGEQEGVFRGHEGDVMAVAWSPDGSRLATGSSDGTVKIWNPENGEALVTWSGHQAVRCVAYAPNGSILAVGDRDGTVRLWDPDTSATRAVLEGHGREVIQIAFAPDGNSLATASRDDTVRLWEMPTGACRAVLPDAVLHHRRDVPFVKLDGGMAFSPDGRRLATVGDTNACIWDTTTGELLVSLEGHTDQVASLAFSPDGSRLLTASWDGTARVWGVSNADMHRSRMIATAIRDRLQPTVDRWFTGDVASAATALAAAKSTMTAEEWRQAANLVFMHTRRTRAPARPSE